METCRYESGYEWIMDMIDRASQTELRELARILADVVHIDQIHDLFDIETDEIGYVIATRFGPAKRE